jgi:hypothetical protein
LGKINEFLTGHCDILIDVLLGCQSATELFECNTQFNLIVEEGGGKDRQCLVLSVEQDRFEPSILEKLDTIFDSYSDSIRGKSAYFVVTANYQ